MSRKSNRSDLNRNEGQKTVHNRTVLKKRKKAKIIAYIKQLITLTALQQAITNNLEKEVENTD